jgi:hypothetical protein
MAITPNTNKLDFHNIKSELKEYLKSQDNLKDYNFEGSTINSVLDVLAYTTHYNAFNANMAVNESFLDTSQLRSSAVSHAKLLGYTPRSYTSATVRADISGASVDSILNRGAVFISNTTEPLEFIVQDDMLSTDTNYLNVKLTQGKLVEDEYRYNANDNEIYYLSNKHSDTSTLIVTVSKPNSTIEEIFVPIKSVSNILNTKNLYWLQENKNGLYSVYFGDGIIGKALDNNDIIKLSYIAGTLDNPTLANNISTLLHNEGVYTVNMFGLQTTSGSPRESIESIKFNSPLSYSAQNRAVTVADYEAIIRSEIPNIKSLNVWGGETEIPPTPGIVHISIIPNDSNNEQIDINVKNQVINHVKKKNVLGIDIRMRDYSTIDLHLDVSYSYNSNLTNNKSNLNTGIRSAILDYNHDVLSTFKGVFRKSNLMHKIDTVSPYVLSSSIDVKMSKKIYFHKAIQEKTNFTLELLSEVGMDATWNTNENKRIQSWAFDVKFSEKLNSDTNISHILSSSSFEYNYIDCMFSDKYVESSAERVINIVHYNNPDLIVARNVGVVDSTNGIVKINNLKLSMNELMANINAQNSIRFIVSPHDNDIHPRFNNILDIKDSNISILPLNR